MQRRYVLAIVAGVAALIAAMAILSTRAPKAVTGPALPTFDYASESSWAVKPATPPPAVWESGWAMDVVLISKTAALEVSEKVTLEKRRDRAARELVDIAAALEGIGPVYAPYLRSGDTGADTMAALTRYLDTDNRGRAFVLVTDAALPADLAPLIEADGMRRDRFAGVLMYGETDAGAPVAPALGCTRRRPLELGCTVPVELRREGGKFRIDGHQPLTDGLTDWLEGHASKLAEPLGDLEEIEIIPIQRPPEPG